MEWIGNQIEQQLERLISGFYRSIFDIGCDRRRRLRIFRRFVVVQLIYLILLEWMNWQSYSHGRTAVIVLVKTGFVLATIVEYLAMIRVGWPVFEIILAFVASVINTFGNIASIVCLSAAFRRNATLSLFRLLLYIWVHKQIVRWFTGIHWSAMPMLIQIRKSIPGQQDPQMLRLLVWNHQDRCELLPPNQLPLNVPFFGVLPLPDHAWPMMEDAPWWIRMKLSENAAIAG